MGHPQYTYKVQGLDATFTSKEEAFRQARNLAAAGFQCASKLGKKFPGIRVTRYGCRNIDQTNQAPYYTYNAEMTIAE